MNRRIIFIVLGALLFLVLIGVLWFWLLGRESDPGTTGRFGAGEDRQSTTIPGVGIGNQQTPFDTGAGQGGRIGEQFGTDFVGEGNVNVQTPLLTPGTTPGSGRISFVYNPATNTYEPVPFIVPGAPPVEGFVPGDGTFTDVVISTTTIPGYTVPGVTWLDTGPLSSFTPTPINQINNVNVSGTPYITASQTGGGGGGGGGGLGLGESLIAAGLAGAVSCGAFLVGGAAGIATFASAFSVQVNVPVKNTEDFMDCLTRTIARIAIAKITASTVDWINSGFDGKPAFIENYDKFFTDVADRAAGAYIQGSQLSFLCSPFQAQVRIAIAQSYAKRRSGEANQCTLTQVVGNVDRFLSGDFSQGGWRGIISLTTVPTNNPFGAYMFAQADLTSAQNRSIVEARARISPGGFLSQVKCPTPIDPLNPNVTPESCRVVTPGQTIEDTLEKTVGQSLDSLQLADHFDEIIAALIQQLMTKLLYEGLGNLSGPRGYQDTFLNPIDAEATAAAEALLASMQQAITIAQQYGGVMQGSIADIQNVQARLLDLENCWISKGQEANAAAAAAQRAELEARIAPYNNNITRANSAITTVQQLHTTLLAAKSLSDVQAVEAQFTAAQTSGQLITAAELTTAQQNRTTLQSEMSALSQQISTQLNQCYATF